MLTLVVLGGFLGAGKTTTMLAAARALSSQGRSVALVTNDQGDSLVDTRIAAAAGNPVGEVTGGCYCCRFDDFADTICGAVGDAGADTVIAEAVGSCADLQATVIRPLRRFYADEMAVAPLTTLVEPARLAALGGAVDHGPTAGTRELAYLFDRQLAEADVIALNKVDTCPPSVTAELTTALEQAYPAATVVAYSARRRDGIAELMAAWSQAVPNPRDVDVDYPRYARGEAELAWLNTDLTLTAHDTTGTFDARAWAVAFLDALSAAAADLGYVVGHAKVALDVGDALVRGSVVAAGGPARVDPEQPVRARTAVVVVNVRMACAPADLQAVTRRAAGMSGTATGVSSHLADTLAFAPSYPRPVHRLAATRPSVR